MKLRITVLLAALFLLPIIGKAQTTVIAKPVSDANGYVAFQIIQIVRIEGSWRTPLEIGQPIYPHIPAKAYPLSRFGEAVVIALPTPGNLDQWQGVYVHNGLIPALNGLSANSFVKDIANRPLPTQVEIKPEVSQLSECPICHKIHLHI